MKNKKYDENLKKIIKAKIRSLSKLNKKEKPSYNFLNQNSTKKVKTNPPISERKQPHRTKKVKRNKIVTYNPRWCGSIFITGGIGDVFAVESFLTDSERQSLTTVYYATNKQKYIEELFRSGVFPNIKNHITLWNDFSKFWCFYSLEDYLIKNLNNKIKNEIYTIKDCSILKIFEKIKNKELKYNGSSFLKYKIDNIEKFEIKENYMVVSPYSTDKRIISRDFSREDWENTLLFCKINKLKAVVINSGQDYIPKSDLIENFTNRTTVTEAVEILKGAKGYFGIDSWLSVLATKLFDSPFLQIKSNNKHCIENADCYYCPKKSFEFIVPKIKI